MFHSPVKISRRLLETEANRAADYRTKISGSWKIIFERAFKTIKKFPSPTASA